MVDVGFRIHSALNGSEGLKKAQEIVPDVIILDVIMPGMDGWAVLAALKAEPSLSQIPVIMSTIISEEATGFSLGATEYITKPIEWKQLSQVLKKHQVGHTSGPILIVEDDEDIRRMLRRILIRHGLPVSEAENGRVALQRVEEETPSLILLDLMMPELNGFDFVFELRKNEARRSIPIIILTAKDITTEERRRLSGHVEKVIQKAAFTKNDLLAQVFNLVKETRSQTTHLSVVDS